MVDLIIKDRIAFITLNRPEKRNALSAEMVERLKDSLKQASESDKVKVVVLKGAGEAFCAGADLKYLRSLQDNTYDENLADSQNLAELFQLIYIMPKVVIAHIEGPAIAGGCGLATVCDFSFATPDSTFGYSEVKIGFVPAIVMVYLLNKIGEGKARDILLSGRFFNAAHAKELGLINRVIDESEIEQEVLKFARKLINGCSVQSMALVKQLISELSGMSVTRGLKYASEMNAQARATADCKRGIAAFLNKEKISW